VANNIIAFAWKTIPTPISGVCVHKTPQNRHGKMCNPERHYLTRIRILWWQSNAVFVDQNNMVDHLEEIDKHHLKFVKGKLYTMMFQPYLRRHRWNFRTSRFKLGCRF